MTHTKRDKNIRQYFTPDLVADFMVESVGANKGWKVIDPACGDGVFLEFCALRGCSSLAGVDIDQEVLRAAEERLIKYDCNVQLFNQDGLLPIQTNDTYWQGEYDLVIGNPPYAARGYRVKDIEVLRRFELSRYNTTVNESSLFTDINVGRYKYSMPIEILFVEQSVKLAKEYGIIALILPISLVSGIQHYYFRKWLFKKVTVVAIVEMPTNIFKNEKTNAKTFILFAIKKETNKKYKPLLINIETMNIETMNIELHKSILEAKPLLCLANKVKEHSQALLGLM